MAQKVQFLGFKRVLAEGLTMQNNYLYFVRETVNDNEGKLWFNGVCYGSCRDSEINDINTALAGFLSGGTVTDVKEYIDSLIGGKDASVTGTSADNHVKVQVDETDGALTSVIVTTSDIASASALTQEISDRETADTALQTEIDAIETAVGLSTGGTWTAGDGKFTSGSTSVADAIDKLDDALASAVTDIETEIQNKINALDADESGSSTYVNVRVQETDGVITSVSVDDSALEDAIQAMDLAQVHEAGKAIVAVAEEDGVVTATAGTIAAQYVDVADAAGHLDATNVEAALAELWSGYTQGDAAIVGDATTSGNTLGKLEDRIEALDANAKEYHIVKTTTGIPETIKERYSLVDADGNVSGDTVDIPKDSHIVSINYITTGEHAQNLEYVYIDASGETQTTYVDMSELVLETEFASGVGVTNHIAHGVVDPTSEAFLTVGADGFKLAGVRDAIDAAKNTATAYTLSSIEALDYTDTAVTGQYVSKVDEANGVISVTRANVSEAVLNNYTKGSDATAVAATDTVNQAISKLENQIDAAQDAATTKVEKDTNAAHLTITSSTASDGSVTYTIGEDDIASASDLTDEIAARKAVDGQTGQTYVANTGATYISGATSLNDADVKLDTALGNLNDNLADLQEDLAATATSLSNAIEDEASARTAADNALDERLDKIEGEYITAVTVNGVDATVVDNAADVTIDAGNVEIGKALTGTTVSAASGDTVDDVLQEIIDQLNQAVAGSYSGVTSTGNTLSVTDSFNGNNVEFVKETATETTAENGHIELLQNSNNEWYGQMYWINEETE